MGNFFYKLCPCCKTNKKNNIYKSITINPRNKELQELLLTSSDINEENIPINKLSDLKFDISNCIIKHYCNPKEYYDFDEKEDKLGEGAYGTVYRIVNKKFKFTRAMKQINKKALNNSCDSSSFVMEIKILMKLDNPNIIKIYEFFEDENFFYIITDYMSEGNLCYKIETMDRRDEVIVGIIMSQIISAVAYLHSNNIIHGDLKPENIMISSSSLLKKRLSFNSSARVDMQELNKIVNSEVGDKNNNNKTQLMNMKKLYFKNLSNFQIKLIDFGCSKILSRKKYKFNDVIGTCDYMSPEVAQNKYNEKCDLWSCGVIMFVLFTGKLPFIGETDEEVTNSILRYEYSLDLPEFENVSKEAKNLINKLLTYDPNERISAMEALNHPFFSKNFDKNNLFNENIDSHEALANMKNFKSGMVFQQIMNGFISYNFISESEIDELRKVFKLIDTNGDGILSRQELMNAFKDAKISMNEEDLDEFLKGIDNNFNGKIEFEEFIRACSDKKKLLCEENLKTAFEILDTNKNGNISIQEIKKTLFGNKNVSDSVLTEFLNQINKEENEDINFEDFKRIMNEMK